MERRANGEGTKVKKHKKGGFYKAITLANGKRKFVYGKSKAVVAEKEREVRKEFEDGVTGEPITLGDFLKRWLNDSVKGSVRQSTCDRYERISRVHITPELGDVKVKNVKPLQVLALYRKKLDSGLSPRTVQYIHRTLHRAFVQAVKWGYVGRNVCDAVESPKPTKKEFTPLSPEQVDVLISATDNTRDRALYLLAVTTGMRQGELLALRWDDVDLKERVVRVRRSLSITTEGVSFVPPKSAKGKRSIGLTASTVRVLEHYRADSGHPGGEVLVFGSRNGTPWAPQNLVRRNFKPLLRRARLPDIRFHDLRHTTATLLLSRNVHPKIVQEMLGHSSITLTLDTYSHYVPSLGEKATIAMEEMVTVGDTHNVFHNSSLEVTGNDLKERPVTGQPEGVTHIF